MSSGALDQRAQDEQWMRRALELATQARDSDEVPVGAVVVQNGEIIGEGSNAPISSNDPTGHAEMIALRQACETVGNYRIPDATLYCTLEPCPMCAGAMVHARIKRVVLGAKEPRAGSAGSVFNLLQSQQLNHRCEVEIGVLQDLSSQMLKDFFRARR